MSALIVAQIYINLLEPFPKQISAAATERNGLRAKTAKPQAPGFIKKNVEKTYTLLKIIAKTCRL
jgi:hypothetical protein